MQSGCLQRRCNRASSQSSILRLIRVNSQGTISSLLSRQAAPMRRDGQIHLFVAHDHVSVIQTWIANQDGHASAKLEQLRYFTAMIRNFCVCLSQGHSVCFFLLGRFFSGCRFSRGFVLRPPVFFPPAPPIVLCFTFRCFWIPTRISCQSGDLDSTLFSQLLSSCDPASFAHQRSCLAGRRLLCGHASNGMIDCLKMSSRKSLTPCIDGATMAET